MHACNEVWYLQSPIANTIQAVLGPVSFKATKKPPVMEPTAKPVKVLEGIAPIPIDAQDIDGASRYIKQEWVAIAIHMNPDAMWLGKEKAEVANGLN